MPQNNQTLLEKTVGGVRRAGQHFFARLGGDECPSAGRTRKSGLYSGGFIYVLGYSGETPLTSMQLFEIPVFNPVAEHSFTGQTPEPDHNDNAATNEPCAASYCISLSNSMGNRALTTEEA